MLKLNQQQHEAANFRNGIASVVAIPGGGKTLTMTNRIGILVKKYKIPPESILGLTFTRNAAQAMRDKLRPILNDLSSRVTLATIHSFCHNLLKQEYKVFELLHGTEQLKFIKKVMKKAKVRNIPTGVALKEIALAKNNLITADDFKELHNDETMQQIADVFINYEKEKQRQMLLDFNDLLTETYKLLTEEKEIKNKYQDIYKHILVDEYQDTNPCQLEILKQLINSNNNSSFWTCADDWQSIYSFTGASVGNVLNFNTIFPKSKQFILNMNYRSTPQILKSCQNLIGYNTKKIEKSLETNNKSGDEVMILEGSNEEDEALKVVQEIKYLAEAKSYNLNDIAILYRCNSQSRAIEDLLKKHGISYHIENGSSFYERFEVKVLLDYLRLIKNPNSDEGDEALTKVINIPNRYIGRKFMTDLEEFADKKNKRLYEALKSMPIAVPYLRKFVKEFIGLIDPLIKDAGKIEPTDMIHILRDGLDYDKFICDDDIPSPDDVKVENINQLQMVANKYSDIESLLSYTNTFKEEISKDENGVSLMTIHKSKGLEFPIVFVIGFIEGVLPNKQGEIEEERRTAFVGMSRAMKLLYVTYSQTYMGRNVKKSVFLDEIQDKK